MSKAKKSDNMSAWCFRREITLGTLLHLLAIVIMLVAGWSNLQKDLALIRHDLTQLIRANAELGQRMKELAGQCQNHEYRIDILENKMTQQLQKPSAKG